MHHTLMPSGPRADPLTQFGLAQNAHAATHVFPSYQEHLAPTTSKRQAHDLQLFCHYIAEHGIVLDHHELLTTPAAWAGITSGVVAGFVRWMKDTGFAIGSINVRLSTVKTYLTLAFQAGYLREDEIAKLVLIKGYTYKQGKKVDTHRPVTRKGAKKAEALSLTTEQVAVLKAHPDTPQGRRDTVLMCLLLDHGLRCGEIADLLITTIDLSAATMTFHREKIVTDQTHTLTPDTMRALQRYLEVCHPEHALLLGSDRHGKLVGTMSRRAITKRVKTLGERMLGISHLSAHDCRHTWVNSAIRGGTDLGSLQDAGGWSSPAMPLRYAEHAQIANAGVRLG